MASHFEDRVRETALNLFNFIEGESPTVFQKKYWTGKVIGWCMDNEAFKVEMFRFIDVFPYLTRPESIAKHLQEYFARPELELPSALQWAVKFLSPTSPAARMIAKTISSNISSMAAQFITGASAREALPALEELRSRGMAFTVDLLGEAVVSEKEAEEYLQRYLDLLDLLHKRQDLWPPLKAGADQNLDWGHSPRINLSIKTSAMYSQMNPRAFDHSVAMAKERLRPIFRKAMEVEAFVSLDMEHYGLKNLTLSLFRSLMEEPEFRDYPYTGMVIQSYLRESESDLMELLRWARNKNLHFTIRLVKGAYWDSEIIWASQSEWPIPVFTNKHETDANFEKLARIILENHQWVTLACASHNIRSIAYVIELAKDLDVLPKSLEFQVLYGMGEPVRNALNKAGLPLRLYAPIGDMLQGMSYLVRRLLENTANESFLRQSFAQGVAREDLLRNPIELLQENPASMSSRGSPSNSLKKDHEWDQTGSFRNEPQWDWSHQRVREEFAQALKRVRRGLPMQIPLFINGKSTMSGKVLISLNPNATEEVVARVSAAGMVEAKEAIQAAKAALEGWRDTDPGTRADYLFRAAVAARKLRFDLAALQVLEVGKAWNEADADVCEAIDFLEYYAREMIRLGEPRRMGHAAGESSSLFYEPRGVGVVIAPWNFPLAISMGMVSAAIVAGNAVVYKPASQSPAIGSMVYEIFRQAGLPAGVLNFLPGSGGEIGDYLVTHPEVAFIAFTGSKEVGLRIIELAARTSPGASCVKNVIAEMGGKNAIIVDADANLDEAIAQILQSAFGYQGQKCSACSRLIVLEENYDRLIERLKAAAESIHLGPVEDPKNFMGAVIDSDAQRRILEYIELGEREGNLLLEREETRTDGLFVPLAIFTDILPEHRLAQEEIFGPVLSVMKAENIDEAIHIANSTPYALTGAVFSRSPENIAKAVRSFRTGNLYINRGCTGAIVERHPFGGFRMSGVGSKAGGPDYLHQFMIPRNVVENTIRRGFAPLR